MQARINAVEFSHTQKPAMTDFAQGFLASIRLGNFRAFGGVQTIPFRPITLIYGPNGSGKSSIVEGIRWLRSLALSKSSVDFNRLVRHHDQTSAIQAGVTIELDAAGHENDPIDYFGRLERQIRSVSVDLTFGSKRTTVAQAFAFFRLGDTPHIQYLELKLNEIPLFRLSELETVGDYFSGFGEFSQETLGLDWFNWNHPIVDFLKAETLTLMRARLSEALGQFKHVPPESEFAPTVRSLLTRVETLLNEINAASDSIFEIDTINEFLERLIFQSAGLFPKVELTADDRAARVFRSDHFRLYFPTIVPENLTPEFVANHFRIATACLVNALHDLENLNSGWHPLTEASFVPAIRSVPTEDFILTDPKQRSNHAPDWLIADAAPERRVEAVQRQIRAINDWLFSLGRTDTNYELLITTERTIVTNVGSSPEEQSLNAAQVRFLGFKDRRNGSIVHLSETGTGFSQLIPVLFASMGGNSPVCIQQPELHLHPALQSELGDLFLKSALDQKGATNQLIIETHSEQILLRIMRRIRETSRQTLPPEIPPVHPNDVCILYIDPRDEGSIVRTMPLTEDGHLLYDWPGGFFEEGLRELLL